MRYLRSTQMKKFYVDWVGVPLWWVAVTVALGKLIGEISIHRRRLIFSQQAPDFI